MWERLTGPTEPVRALYCARPLRPARRPEAALGALAGASGSGGSGVMLSCSRSSRCLSVSLCLMDV
jgi:hypothetical protein